MSLREHKFGASKLPPQDYDCRVSGDGRVLASADADGDILIWDADKGNKLHVLKNANKSLIRSLALSSDGRILVSGSDDGSIVVWDVKRGEASKLRENQILSGRLMRTPREICWPAEMATE